jgi:hypothetical protein
MTEPDQIEFHERVSAPPGPGDSRSLPVRIGIVAGSALLLVVGAVAAMGASPAAPTTGDQANLAVAVPDTVTEVAPPDHRLGGGIAGRGLFASITITAIDGSSLSLKTDDGWTRTIAVGSSTEITKGGETIALGDLAVGDQVRFTQERATDGTYSITAIRVVLPTLGGEVTAVSGDTITVTRPDETTGTIHVDGDTTYTTGREAGDLSDVTVGSLVIAEGTLRADGSLDADAVHTGLLRFRDGDGPGRFFEGMPGMPDMPGLRGMPEATPTPSSSAS